MSAGRVFFDTNILLYAYGDANPEKQARARSLVEKHTADGSVLISTQVAQEFYVAGLRKLRLPRSRMRAAVHALLELPLITVDAERIAEALEMEDRYRISFWDALILAAAAFGKAGLLYTEDLNDGQIYGTVTVRNPFSAAVQ